MNLAEKRITPNADTASPTERQRPLLNRSLHELTHEHEDSKLIERFLLEVEDTDWTENTKSEVRAALAVALETHDGQERGLFPYSTHFLRVATRMLSRNHFSIRDQPDLIVAALLHDSVEDRPTELMATLASHPYEDPEASDNLKLQKLELDNLNPKDVATAQFKLQLQEAALEGLSYYFGDDIAQLVGIVTNPPSNYNLSKPERNDIYQKHVEDLLQDNPLAGILKLSDFIDNSAGLKYNESPKKAKVLAEISTDRDLRF